MKFVCEKLFRSRKAAWQELGDAYFPCLWLVSCLKYCILIDWHKQIVFTITDIDLDHTCNNDIPVTFLTEWITGFSGIERMTVKTLTLVVQGRLILLFHSISWSSRRCGLDQLPYTQATSGSPVPLGLTSVNLCIPKTPTKCSKKSWDKLCLNDPVREY